MGADKFGWDDDDLIPLSRHTPGAGGVEAAKPSGVRRHRRDAKLSDAKKADVAGIESDAKHQD